MNRWHFKVQNKLRKQLSSLVVRPSKLPISHPDGIPTREYRPDLLLEKDGRTIIIEVESYSSPNKIIEDLLFSFMAKADELVTIFSNIKGRGQKRAEGAKILEEITRGHLPVKLPKTKILWIEDENDKKLANLCSNLRS